MTLLSPVKRHAEGRRVLLAIFEWEARFGENVGESRVERDAADGYDY